MFDLEAQIKEWRGELRRAGIATEVADELEGHLRERVDRLLASGSSEPEAFRAASQQLGDSKTLKTEFSKLQRGPLRVFRGNSLGINLLGGWFVFTGLIFFTRELIGLCLHLGQFANQFLQNYSFKDVGPISQGGFASFAFGIIMFGLWTMTGVGLLRRWKFCYVTTLWFAVPAIYFRIYYDVLGYSVSFADGRPVPATWTVHHNILGWFNVPTAFYYAFQYVVLAILIWGVCSLLRLWSEKFFRRATAG